jgi:hypothetical protein
MEHTAKGRVGGFFSGVGQKVSEKIGRFIHGNSLDGLSAKVSKKETVEPEIEISHTEEVKEEAIDAGSITQDLTDQVPVQNGESEKPAEDTEELDEDLDEEITPDEEPEQESDLPAEPEPTPAPEKRAEPSVMESILSAGAKEVEKKPTTPDVNSEKAKEQERLKNMSPEDRAYEEAINFTEKFEKFISGLSSLDIAKGFTDFSRRAKELLSIPEGVDEDKFDLTQDRIMYNIARDKSFSKDARDLLVTLLERRGAVKVASGPDGKKIVTRTVGLGETAKEMLKNDTPEMRKKRMEFTS